MKCFTSCSIWTNNLIHVTTKKSPHTSVWKILSRISNKLVYTIFLCTRTHTSQEKKRCLKQACTRHSAKNHTNTIFNILCLHGSTRHKKNDALYPHITKNQNNTQSSFWRLLTRQNNIIIFSFGARGTCQNKISCLFRAMLTCQNNKKREYFFWPKEIGYI